MRAFKPHLAGLAAYPYRKVDAPIKLDQNESPWDLPPDLKERALARMRSTPWNRYPDMHAESVRALVGRHQGWPDGGVVVAPGSNFLVLALALAANRVLDTVPSFAFYEAAARLAGTPYEAVPLGEGFALPLQGLLARMSGPAGVLFVAVPHAPTGALFPEREVRALAARAREEGWLLAIDEAYFQFSGTDHRDLARENPSVVLLRTFSKAFGLGGVRAGYLLAAPDVASRLQAMLPPFDVPAHTAAVLETVLASPERASEAAELLVAERERVIAGLRRHPTWKVHESRANFFLVRTPDAEVAWKGLLAAGVLVRRQDHLPGLAGCLRVSVGTPAENDAFLRAALALR
ncbi:MAG TPA: histidinol-phosphate transaminase [Anaeromyxobacteraceae bacterium]|nr:histidinol-phosphate transaminase [Anaeromyxobacteraceae bacterium]